MNLEKRNWLIDFRKDAELTKQSIAEKESIDRTTYTKAEAGYPSSIIKTAKQIAAVLNFDKNYKRNKYWELVDNSKIGKYNINNKLMKLEVSYMKPQVKGEILMT